MSRKSKSTRKSLKIAKKYFVADFAKHKIPDNPLADVSKNDTFFNPSQIKRNVDDSITRIIAQNPTKKSDNLYRTYFHMPFKVPTCLRRFMRRSVLFAKNKIGKGKKTKRFHRWTNDSFISCKG